MKLFPWVAGLILCGVSFAQVQVSEQSLTLPSSVEGKPDPNPPFDQFAGSKFNYPYTLRDEITQRTVPVTYRAVVLENQYLRCTVLPDLGGHLYGCTDKTNGAEMFYANRSIKKAKVSYRGAWAAFGIEFNFPVSHNWVSLSPVPYAIQRHSDGSASVWVSNVDRVYGMQWRVELKLRPGSTVLEQHNFLYNRSATRHRFYWWTNAAVRVWDDSRILYPQRYTASHGFKEIDTWPINHAGLDLSVVGNHTAGPVSQFAHESREPFAGVYHPKTDAGVIHYSLPSQAPHRKIWAWGVDPDGRDWRKALSDDESAYVEVQGGVFRNQETYAFLEPQQTLEFTEYWMPVRQTGGFVRANLDAIVNIDHSGTATKLRCNVTHPIPGARVSIRQGTRILADKTADLAPDRVFTVELPSIDGKITVNLTGRDGRVLLTHTEDEYDMAPAGSIPIGPVQPVPESKSAEVRILEDGRDRELNGDRLRAWTLYQDGLARFPESRELGLAAGRLALDLFRYKEAAGYLKAAQNQLTNDPETHYLLGLALFQLGDERGARTQWEHAMLFPAYRPAAAIQLGLLEARQGHLTEALALIGKSGPEAVRAAVLQAALLKRLGRSQEAATVVNQGLIQDPTNVGLRYLRSADDATWKVLAADPERVLEVAEDDMDLGFWAEALELLNHQYPEVDETWREPGSVLPQRHALVAYYRAYCLEKTGVSAQPAYLEAARLPLDYIFPSRRYSLPVLQRAIALNPADTGAKLLLGDLLMAAGQVDEAIVEWQLARQGSSKLATLHRNLGLALLRIKNQPEEAARVLQEGLGVDPRNPAVYEALDQALSIQASPPSERAAALQRYPDPAGMPQNLLIRRALTVAASGQAAVALQLISGRFFAREELGTNIRQVYVEIELQHAQELARTGRKEEAIVLGRKLGQPVPGLEFTRDGMAVFLENARIQYILGELEAEAGHMDEARACWRRAMDRAGRGSDAELAYAARASRKLGKPLDPQAMEKRLARGSAPGSGIATYGHGELLRSAGREAEALAEFRRALLLDDRGLAHHLSALALRQAPLE
ncbi:DUF5107 domain-containing protein [Paludibaculum fermentans]|uniref:DUF5107 domain-containing protein n=1 Tax=Paludibaculum fermentans TaxID=1473598 RepID=A0A7S7NW70_PALFE|nr:DUF5107 domain-containing protein [Paludibaculum fermentans]QOY90935.1 DUF5107 domain-containing protein [Paludibaculum fermentans]